MVKVVEIHLEGVGEDRRDGDVNGEEDADDLDVALRAEFVELQRDGEHKVEHNEVVEENGVEITVRAKEISDIALGVDDRRHQEHIQHKRSEAGECRGVRDVAVFAVVKCVEGKKIKEKAAVVEGQGVQVVRAVDAGVYLLAYLEHEECDRDDLKGKIFKGLLAACQQLCQKDREQSKHQKGRCYLIEVSHCPKSHSCLRVFGWAFFRRLCLDFSNLERENQGFCSLNNNSS